MSSNVSPLGPDLVRDAAHGDRTAQEAIFVAYRDAAYAVAFRVTGRHEDAMDVVQDSFIRAFQRLGDFRGTDAATDGRTADRDGFSAALKTWLLRIVSNRALDALRARKVRVASSLDAGESRGERLDPPDESGTGVALEQSEISAEIRAAVEELPPEQRVVFALYASGDMTYGQIAEAVGIPIGTVMSRLYHARRKLMSALPHLAPRRGANQEERTNSDVREDEV